MKKIISYLVLSSLIIIIVFGTLFITPPEKAAAYDRNLLCTDAGLVNSSALNTTGIQAFLVSKGSFLKSYSQGGRTAAQIINDAAKENGINPVAILAMIQKEQSLVSMSSYNQGSLDWAMGYGATDSATYQQFKGFTTQIDNGTWQLRKNYDYWATNGSVWNVGKSMLLKPDNVMVTFGNKCTSAQYRYTPHLGVNFMNNFNAWGGNGYYGAQYVTQGPRTGPGAWNVALLPGQKFIAWVNFKNTGTTAWTSGGATPTHLGVSRPMDHGSPFLGGKNLRGSLVQSTVPPGGVGTFKIAMTVPNAEGTYIEHFQPVVENVGWLDANVSWTFNVSRGLAATQANARYLSQGPRSGPGAWGVPIDHGDVTTLWVKYVNTGKQTWFRNGNNPVHIGTNMPQDRKTAFYYNKNVRGYLVESSVPPGGVGTFNITTVAPSSDGNYLEHFRPVMEGVTWFGPDVSWTLKVH